MAEFADLINKYGFMMVATLATTGALIYVTRLLYIELTQRAARAEELVSRFGPSIDRLADAVEIQNKISQALLDERRQRS